ncbi:IS481 family transposase [Amycolatopsis magusensis]|uniref:Transposase InsO family protein n=1 Tax=Amycolatopsis magusensis TaxID=882444 RepID=A0ABS4PYQ5_9PSEU|nr:IS481 family transposase [Amycolatopsis magusensis]MBP2184562.1 transposase InsO family protein [Amycolatopsis magusensis]
MSHRNARLTVYGRRLLVQRVTAGRPVAHVAAEMGVSRATAHKWVRRYRLEGEHGLHDRSSRPRHCPRRTTAEAESAILALRRSRRLGPARIAGILGLHASTVHRVLTRHHERARPGELVHVDVKKLGRIRDGGGWRAHGRDSPQRHAARRAPRAGYDYVHCAIDDHTRLAYAEIHPDETATTCADFLRRAAQALAAHGIPAIERVMTDNAMAYRRSRAFAHALTDIGATHRLTRAYRPQTNGKAERFNRTLTEEWAYAHTFTSSKQRADTLPDFLHTYNHHRAHTALAGQPPITRVNNASGQYS